MVSLGFQLGGCVSVIALRTLTAVGFCTRSQGVRGSVALEARLTENNRNAALRVKS